MIIVRLNGGLGNQMFQYVLGKRLSLKNEDSLKLDISDLEKRGKDSIRSYKLHFFNIVASIATHDEINPLRCPAGVFSKAIDFFEKKVFRKFHIGWEPEILEKKGDIYVDGFWQSYKYLEGIEDSIRSDFTLKHGLSERGEKIVDTMHNVHAISVHIRRGDYVSDAKTNTYHGTCSPAYYKEAINFFNKKITSPVFFVFSDDITWVKSNMDFLGNEVVYVSQENIPDYEELILMSKCKHHIIANSTFSWWGAWLNPYKDKMVVAPRQWYKKDANRAKDLLPPEWVRL